MLVPLIIILVIVSLLVISTYNFFVTTRTRLSAAVQEIGNQLKRQASLIPNLEESVKGYLKHEKGIYTELTEARKAVSGALKTGNIEAMTKASDKLAEVLPKIQIQVESNPELKGSEVVSQLMEELRDTADKLMYSRRLLIDLTADFNTKLVTFPTNLVANLFHFEKAKGLVTSEAGNHLEVASDEMVSPKIKL